VQRAVRRLLGILQWTSNPRIVDARMKQGRRGQSKSRTDRIAILRLAIDQANLTISVQHLE
jgi:hypothetical protein